MSDQDSHTGLSRIIVISFSARLFASTDTCVPRIASSTAAPNTKSPPPTSMAPATLATVRHAAGPPAATGHRRPNVWRRSTRCQANSKPSGSTTAAACCTGIASAKSAGAMPCAYQSPARPMASAVNPCATEGRRRRAGRDHRLPATSGPRKRISSSVSRVAVTCKRSQTTTADEMSDTASGKASRSIAPAAAGRSGRPPGRDWA